MRAYVREPWLTKRFVIGAVFWLSIGGPAIGAAVFAFFDQAVRNTVDTWMSGRELVRAHRLERNAVQRTTSAMETKRSPKS